MVTIKRFWSNNTVNHDYCVSTYPWFRSQTCITLLAEFARSISNACCVHICISEMWDTVMYNIHAYVSGARQDSHSNRGASVVASPLFSRICRPAGCALCCVQGMTLNYANAKAAVACMAVNWRIVDDFFAPLPATHKVSDRSILLTSKRIPGALLCTAKMNWQNHRGDQCIAIQKNVFEHIQYHHTIDCDSCQSALDR